MIRWAAACAILLAVSSPGSANPPNLRDRLGQQVTLEGVAETRKLGAALRGNGFDVWIDRMEAWPADTSGRRVRVTGTLDEQHDLPVYVAKPGEPASAGIPVPEGTNLREASRRYVIREATWGLVR